MRPDARAQAAIEILDRILSGRKAEPALADWGRKHRFAGSGDRAAIADIVYDCLRCRRSLAACSGRADGRGLVIGWAEERGGGAAALFTGAPHAPAPLKPAERAALATPRRLTEGERLDCPDWLLPAFRAALGPRTEAVLSAFRHRAPVFLRANLARTARDELAARLAREGVETRPHPLSRSALEVVSGPRNLHRLEAWAEGLFDLQDAASQAVIDALPLPERGRILDLCAGAGGKALAMAERTTAEILAHDRDPARMRDLPRRAARLGARIGLAPAPEAVAGAGFDLVLCDVPCSGSGTWRRDPEGKWRLDPARLASLRSTQWAILERAARLVRPGGEIAYVTCSLLRAENEEQIARLGAEPAGLEPVEMRRIGPEAGSDGFFLARLRRRNEGHSPSLNRSRVSCPGRQEEKRDGRGRNGGRPRHKGRWSRAGGTRGACARCPGDLAQRRDERLAGG